MIRITIFLLLTLVFSLPSFAQHDHNKGFCGTKGIDLERTKANIAYAKANPLEGSSTTSGPIRIRLIGEKDGTNAALTNDVVDLMAAVNLDFAPYDIQFFLEDSDGQVWDYSFNDGLYSCLLYTSPSPRDRTRSRMPSSA